MLLSYLGHIISYRYHIQVLTKPNLDSRIWISFSFMLKVGSDSAQSRPDLHSSNWQIISPSSALQHARTQRFKSSTVVTSAACIHQLVSSNQCCGSELIYSGSGSSPYLLFKQIWRTNFVKHTLNSIKRRIYQLSTIFYFILQSYSTHSPEFTGLKLEIKFLFIRSLIFLLDTEQKNRIREKVQDPCGSGSTTQLVTANDGFKLSFQIAYHLLTR